jgi:hypothetical protein
MEQAIKKAIEGGFDFKELLIELGINPEYEVKVGKKYLIVRSFQGNEKQLCSFEKLLLKPKFWQALGKAEGWKSFTSKPVWLEETSIAHKFGFDEDEGKHIGVQGLIPVWKENWHRFIDHLAEGKDIDNFFNELLK